MSILRGSVTAEDFILFIDSSLAWEQAPQWGKRRKKSASEASREVSATTQLASFVDIFPI